MSLKRYILGKDGIDKVNQALYTSGCFKLKNFGRGNYEYC